MMKKPQFKPSKKEKLIGFEPMHNEDNEIQYYQAIVPLIRMHSLVMFLQFINPPWCPETLDKLTLFSLLVIVIIRGFPSKGLTKQTHHTFKFLSTKIMTCDLHSTF